MLFVCSRGVVLGVVGVGVVGVHMTYVTYHLMRNVLGVVVECVVGMNM